MRPATTTVEDDAASVVNIFCSCCFNEVFCVTFSTSAYFCFFQLCFIDDISTKSSLRLWFSLNFICVALFQAHQKIIFEEEQKRKQKERTRTSNVIKLSHIHSFTNRNVSSAQLIQSVNQCLGGTLSLVLLFFSSFVFVRIWEKKKSARRAQFGGRSDVHNDEMDKSFIERDEVFRCSF